MYLNNISVNPGAVVIPSQIAILTGCPAGLDPVSP